VSITGSESGLGHVSRLDTDLVVTRPKINLGKDSSPSELMQQVIDPRQGVLVFNYDLFQLVVVNA
jgi:hypothetical protein